MSLKTIEDHESCVRGYVRSFPVVFDRALGSRLYAEDGREFLDFLVGAGTLSYGHNNEALVASLVAYLRRSGIAHGLDLATRAKIEFIEAFNSLILAPRKLDYKMMFCGPTGTNAIESALKLARKVTGRTEVAAFTNAFHGMTLGSLALTGNRKERKGAGLPLGHVIRFPFDGYLGQGIDTLPFIEKLLEDPSSGVDEPAAMVLEIIQAEGGVNVASKSWVQGVSQLAKRQGALLILDDIQIGCGRTGPFFSFEEFQIEPDIICLSKALSGFGLPMSLVLIRPEHDIWEPGEHNGTFRGNNLAFVTARKALEVYWATSDLETAVRDQGKRIATRLQSLGTSCGGVYRGRGLIAGLAFDDPSLAGRVSRAAFERGVIIETSGPRGEVLKLLPPLTISEEDLNQGIDIIESSVESALEHRHE